MQHSRLRLVDLNYHCHDAVTSPEDVLAIHAASDGYAFPLNEKVDVSFVKHANCDLLHKSRQISFRFFRSRNRFWHIPFASHSYIKKLQPGFVLVQGFVFPLQVIALKLRLGKHVKILVQHHGETPYSGVKKIIQRLADSCIDKYLFTGVGNAAVWTSSGIIKKSNKIAAIQAASSAFYPLDKNNCKKELGITGDYNFLWVGHLTALKDPLTVVYAFSLFLTGNPAAKLFMFYGKDDLLDDLKKITSVSPALQHAVHFMGRAPHPVLQKWYSACNYFVSGSRSEACGYALLEAMACGCIPIVTAIPSFEKITAGGKAGFLFEPGNITELHQILHTLETSREEIFSAQVKKHFTEELSFKKIAADIFTCCSNLHIK